MSAVRIEFRHYRRSFRRPLRTARGLWREREGWILRLVSGAASGFGEVAPFPGCGCESAAEAATALAGLPAGDESADALAARVPDLPPCCAFALRSALGQLAVRPAPVAAEALAVAALLPAGAAGLEALTAARAAGYSVFKWKIGTAGPDAELDWLDGMLAALPAGGRLRLDANGAFDRRQLERWLAALEAHAGGIDFLEQPMAPGEEETVLAAAAGTPVPIALDETLNTPGGRRWLAAGAWPGPLVLKPAVMGDPSALGPFDPARVVLSSVFETAVGARNALDALAGWGGSDRAAGFGTLGAFDDPFGGVAPSPRLAVAEFSDELLEQVWNSLAE